MLARARARTKRARLSSNIALIRGDIRFIPFPGPSFSMVMAPYGILQSLLRERDLTATLSEVHRVLEPGGTFGIELVADLPSWKEYQEATEPQGMAWSPRRGACDARGDGPSGPARHLTIFDQEFTERRGGTTRVHRFALTFRTLSVPQMVRRLEKSGFEITALLGDYRGRAWDPRAEVWVILARTPRR